MDQKRLTDLFRGYMNNEISVGETDRLFDYMNAPENAEKVAQLFDAALDDQQVERYLTEKQKRMMLGNILQTKAIPVRTLKTRWLTIIQTAAAVLIIGILGWFLVKKQPNKSANTNNKNAKNDILPGGFKAILTLGNGSKVVLNNTPNGYLVKQGNTQITKLSNGTLVYNAPVKSKGALLYNTMSTPLGGEYKLTLPDGTMAWLNASSSITYPSYFSGKERRVKITGEVYFEVAKNKNMPFYVTSGRQVLEVLGTHFDVNAYSDEAEIKTTLLEGSVRLSLNQSLNKLKNEQTLKPGDQSALKNDAFNVMQVDVNQFTAWKNGITVFENADIQTIMRQLSRWYDIEVVFQQNIPERLFTGEVSRKAKLSEALKVLELSGINFKLKGRQVIVLP